MSFEFFIGRRYLRSRQKLAFISLITFLSVAGVAVGVMALIVVISVMAGFESDLKSRILSVDSHMVIDRPEGEFANYKEVAAFVSGLAEVTAVTPFITTQTMLRTSGGVSGAMLRGIDPDDAAPIIRKFTDGDLARLEPAVQDAEAADEGLPGILLGQELARNLGVLEGDTVYVISPRGMISPIGHVPSMRRFRVTGYFTSGMYEYDGTLAYIHLREAQKMLRMGDAVTGIEVRVDDLYATPDISERIVAELGSSYQVRDWMEMNRNFFSALKLEKTVMFVILTLIILVAAFNIASSLTMMVMEKTQDIAILKAMGATDRSIRKIFMLKGLFVGGLGTIIGVSCGALLCFLLERYHFVRLPSNVYYITTIPVRMESLDITIIAVAAVAISFLATLYPARQASRLNPVEALRYG